MGNFMEQIAGDLFNAVKPSYWRASSSPSSLPWHITFKVIFSMHLLYTYKLRQINRSACHLSLSSVYFIAYASMGSAARDRRCRRVVPLVSRRTSYYELIRQMLLATRCSVGLREVFDFHPTTPMEVTEFLARDLLDA